MAFGAVGFPEQFDMISLSAGNDPNGYAAQMPNPNKGVEIRFTGNMAGKAGGYQLIAGIGRNSQTDDISLESANAGGSFADTRYARATLKFSGEGLLSGSGGTFGNQIIGLDNSVTFGLNFYNSGYGGNVNAADYMSGLTKTAWGGDVRINYGNARLVGQYTRFVQVVDEYGTNWGGRNAYSLEGDYGIYPWLFAELRYEHMKDDLNGEYTKLIPGIGALIRPNFKVGIEFVDVTKNTVVDNGLNNIPGSSISLFTQLGF